MNLSTMACNFLCTQQTGVDPRTGQFMVNLPVAKLVGNYAMGPVLNLSLSYSPLNTHNYGFGVGFSLGLSTFNNRSHLLELSNGEKYRIAPGSDVVLNKKLANFHFQYLNGINDQQGYVIRWKSGEQEFLEVREDRTTFVPTRMLSPTGRQLFLSWQWSGSYPQLTRISDESVTLLEARYGTRTLISVWPGSAEAYELRLELSQFGSSLDRISRQISASEVHRWHFGYDLITPGERRLTRVAYPTGMIEEVTYSHSEGLRFPAGSGQGTLPCVITHRRHTGSGNPDIVSHYQYSNHNFLGFNGNFGQWSSDSDYLYTTLTDYLYSSTVNISDGADAVLITRTYNNYHLQVSEEITRQQCVHLTQFSYYAEKFVFIESQPPQFQLLKERRDRWIDSNGREREVVVQSEFDINGNPVRQREADGTETVMTWYPAEGEAGCPPEPNGFVRFMKSKTLTPRPSSYHSPVTSTHFTYTRLQDPAHIVQHEVSCFTDTAAVSKQEIIYSQDSDSRLYGRIVNVIDTLVPHGAPTKSFRNEQNIHFAFQQNTVESKTVFQGFDGVTSESSVTESALSGLLLEEVNNQQIKSTWSYDTLGRITRRSSAVGTRYENTLHWTYAIENGYPTTTQSDVLNNALKTLFDGAGRECRRLRNTPEEPSAWYEIASSQYDVFGDLHNLSQSDWIPGPSPTHFEMKTTANRNGWGEIARQNFADGTGLHRETNPAALTHTEYAFGEMRDGVFSTDKVTTAFDTASFMPIVQTRRDADDRINGRKQFDWDGSGRLRVETDELGRRTTFTYDGYGRVVTQSLPDGTLVTRTYAPHLTGEYIASITVRGADASGRTRIWLLGTQTWDSLGRLMRREENGRVTRYLYNSAAPLPSSVILPAGQEVAYEYIPELNNVISRVSADGVNQTFDYHPQTGEMLSSRENSIATVSHWNPSGDLIEENFTRGDRHRRCLHERTLSGQPTAWQDVTGKKVRYERDRFGKVVNIIDDELSVTLGYDALQRANYQLIRNTITRRSLSTTRVYDGAGREERRIIRDSRGTILDIAQSWLDNNLLASRRILRNDVVFSEENYAYDARNRLISYTVTGAGSPPDAYGQPIAQQRFEYDALNNITRVITRLSNGESDRGSYLYENRDDPTQLTAVTHTHRHYPARISLEYDTAGRMIRDEAGRTLKYDILGRLVSVFDGRGGPNSEYRYDAMNQQVSQIIEGDEARELFFRAGELVNEECVNKKITSRLVKFQGECLGVNNGNQLTMTASDNKGSLIWTDAFHAWTPYGHGNSTDLFPGFTGERPDPANGLYHLGNGYRAYNPVLMRFNCPDSMSPFGPGGINAYAYCSGDPVNNVDPSGHMSWQGITGIVVSGIGLALSIFTAGASIAAAGGVVAALGAASATSLVVGSLGVAADVTAIASAATEDSDPEASSILGWISMATGIGGMFLGISRALSRSLNSAARYNLSQAAERSGRGHFPLARFSTLDEVTTAPLSEASPETMWRIVQKNVSGSNAPFIFGADREIYGGNLHTPLGILARKKSILRRDIVILSGTHGRDNGYNWAFNGKRFIRDPEILENAFFHEDILLGKRIDKGHFRALKPLKKRIKVIDMEGMDAQSYAHYVGDPANHVILAYCFGRNDNLFRHVRKLESVISYV